MPKDTEVTTLAKIGSQPVEKTKPNPYFRKRTPGEMQRTMYLRRRQAFIYHTCDLVAPEGWRSVQSVLNETQLELERAV